MQFLDFILELLDKVKVSSSDFCVVGLNIRVFLGVLGCQFLDLIVLLIL